jgi:hypothetical protein
MQRCLKNQQNTFMLMCCGSFFIDSPTACCPSVPVYQQRNPTEQTARFLLNLLANPSLLWHICADLKDERGRAQNFTSQQASVPTTHTAYQRPFWTKAKSTHTHTHSGASARAWPTAK